MTKLKLSALMAEVKTKKGVQVLKGSQTLELKGGGIGGSCICKGASCYGFSGPKGHQGPRRSSEFNTPS